MSPSRGEAGTCVETSVGDSLGPSASVFGVTVGSGRLSKLHRVHWRLGSRGRTVLPVDSTTRKAGAATASRGI